MGKSKPPIITADTVPCVGDPFWWKATEPLFDFIASGPDHTRPINEIGYWAKDRKMRVTLLINSLAWLSVRNIVYAHEVEGIHYWTVRAWALT